MEDEIKALREEIAALRKELARVRAFVGADRVQTQPAYQAPDQRLSTYLRSPQYALDRGYMPQSQSHDDRFNRFK